MHKISTKESVPSIIEAINILTEHTNTFGVPLDYDRMLEYEAYYTLEGTRIKKEIIRYTGSTKSAADYKDDDFRAFLRDAKVSTGLLSSKKGKISVSGESLEAAIATGLYSEEVNSILNKYIEAGKCFKAISIFSKIFETYPVCSVETWDNHRMIMTKPTWVPQNTGRIGAQNPGIMNIGKAVHDIFTVPKGYKYFEIDSGQIEPRIIQSAFLHDEQLKKCTMLYNDAYYGYIHYCVFLTDEQRRSGTLDFGPIEITPEMEALRKKFKTFGNATMYGSTENLLNDKHKAAFIKYIGGHPHRLNWQHQIEDKIDRGQRIFKTVWGTPIDITKGPSDSNYEDKASNAYFSHLVKCAINNPIQGTGADLMRYSIKKADELLKAKAPSSFITQYVHDAGKFAIAEEDYDAIKDELREITAYQVDDWIPIYADVEEGAGEGSVKRFLP